MKHELDYDRLMARVGEARFVLLGEASHGTHEFYRERAEITKRLILEKGFTAVAVEGDWPDAYRVNRFVRGAREDADANAALSGFRRFPAWMWRNRVVLDFVGWLRRHNEGAGDAPHQAGFYGLDLYSLFTSIEEVLGYLDKVDPAAARRARERYGCFDHFNQDTQEYGYATASGAPSCEDDVVGQLVELRRRAAEYAERDGRTGPDEFFFAEQNARLVANAEEYYRAMFRGRGSSWNLRDRHMAETLEALRAHLELPGRPAKIVVWAHNSHLGDARATEMSDRGELNLGQLVRERHGENAVLVGFTTYQGSVTAAADWGGPAERMRVRPGLEQSIEAYLHTLSMEAPAPRALLITRRETPAALRFRRLERFIGVIYRPKTERLSHYYHALLHDQFDTVVHIDETSALEPLERGSQWQGAETPETFPSGL